MSDQKYSSADLNFLVDAFVGKLDDRFKTFEKKIDQRFVQVDKRFEKADQRFDSFSIKLDDYSNQFKAEIDDKFSVLSADVDRGIAVGLEKMDDKLAFVIENIDDRIAYHVRPLRQDVQVLAVRIDTVKAAVTANGHDIRRLDKAIANLEHRVDRVYHIADDHIRLGARLAKLESAA